MRRELLYSPLLFMERVGEWATERRRLRKLRGTVAAQLATGYIDSLELLELLRPLNPQVIYDVGANVGTWTLLAKAIFPAAEVHAFEPLEAHCATFSEATSSLLGVRLHRLALGSVRANPQMHVFDRSDASSLLEMTREGSQRYGLRDERTVIVPLERLDDVVCAQSLPQPDIIKLDIQGFELEALRGAGAALRGARAIISEVSFVELYHGQCLFCDLVGFLAEHGFSLSALGGRTILGKPLLQADALFVAEAAGSQLAR
jgi:FkbM family methyltransferase